MAASGPVGVAPDHADEMAPVLDDVALHRFIGGQPATREELRDRYTQQAVGRSPDGAQRWLNWIIRRRDTGQAVGTTQATVRDDEGLLVAEVAWVVASVHPQHHASMAVAQAVGLSPTDVVTDGEVRWQG